MTLGKFHSTIDSGRKRFLTVADQLLSGRICIASMSLGGAKACLSIAVRYLLFLVSVGLWSCFFGGSKIT